MKQIFYCIVLCLFLAFVSLNLSFATPYNPYNIQPYDTDSFGNSASRNSGGYFDRPSQGYYNLVYWLGTEGGPSMLNLQYDVLFGDGPNEDFAIVTGNECWGIYAKEAKIDFYLDYEIQGSMLTEFTAGQIYLFDLPGGGIVANRIEIWNITSDPPGINNDGTMEFIYAGTDMEAVKAATPIPEPGTIWLISLGIVGFIVRSQLPNRRDSLIQN